MDTENVNISVGLPPNSTPKIAAMYFDIFSRKLGAVLGRRTAVAVIADHINADRIIVAIDGGEIVGIAGLKYNGNGFFAPDRRGFLKHYGPLVGCIRAGLWTSVQTNPRPHQLLLDGLGVQAELRGRGIGTALLMVLITEFIFIIHSIPLAKAIANYRSL